MEGNRDRSDRDAYTHVVTLKKNSQDRQAHLDKVQKDHSIKTIKAEESASSDLEERGTSLNPFQTCIFFSGHTFFTAQLRGSVLAYHVFSAKVQEDQVSIVKYHSICQRRLYRTGSTEYLRLAHRSGNQHHNAGTPFEQCKTAGRPRTHAPRRRR